MRLNIESSLVTGRDREILLVDADPSVDFLDAAVEAHVIADPTLSADNFVGVDGQGRHCELEYVEQPEGMWFPVTMHVPAGTTVGTVGQFFGAEVTSDQPRLRVRWRSGRGGDGYYPGTVALDLIRAAFEIYGYAVAGRELARFTARHRARVPFKEVERWTNTGIPSSELVDYVRIEPVRSPAELELLLRVSRRECVELLQASGYRQATADGMWWYHPTDDAN
jgi:hypothetical protein